MENKDLHPPNDIFHHGIKGMHWGVRKNRTSEEKAASRAKLKRNVKITAGVLAVVGAAATVAVLGKGGSTAVKAIKDIPDLTPGLDKVVIKNKFGTSTYGHEAVKAFDQHVWKQSVSALSKDIAEANFDQDQYMRSIGLGHIVNNSRI